MRRRGRRNLIAHLRFYGPTDSEQLEPGQGIVVIESGRDSAVGQLSERPQNGARIAGIERLSGRGPEGQLRRWEVPMAARARSSFGPQDAVLFEIADHPR